MVGRTLLDVTSSILLDIGLEFGRETHILADAEPDGAVIPRRIGEDLLGGSGRSDDSVFEVLHTLSILQSGKTLLGMDPPEFHRTRRSTDC